MLDLVVMTTKRDGKAPESCRRCGAPADPFVFLAMHSDGEPVGPALVLCVKCLAVKADTLNRVVAHLSPEE
jgi:hypothetical protein